MESISVDVAVIGAGPGGYVCALRASQLGLKTACIDRGSSLGGTCLNVGCIPSKTLLKTAHTLATLRQAESRGLDIQGIRIDLGRVMAYKNQVIQELNQGIHFMMRKSGVQVIQGEASFHTPHTLHVRKDDTTTTVEARWIVIATGSETVVPDSLPADEDTVLTSSGALCLDTVPGHMVVAGMGYIGLEMAFLWHDLGSQITMVEAGDTLLPSMDQDIQAHVRSTLDHHGIAWHTGTRIAHVERQEEGVLVHLLPSPSGSRAAPVPEAIRADKVLVAAGRKPHTGHLGLDAVDITCDARGFITTDSFGRIPGQPHILAIGDVTAGPMLAHRASEEALMVAEYMAGAAPRPLNSFLVPAVMFLSPEIASVGQSEQNLREAGIAFKVGRFPFSSSGRARATGDLTGFVKILSAASNGRILGVHMVGAEVSTLIGQAVLAMEFGACAEDLARTCMPHPSFAETLKEAAMHAAWS